ncbi:uncharacterized protein DUF2777 [Thermolongibacillus altinsuensis]|jgi:hypothetical protein|uniref:Uncharacterized protein DUF2777 n=2 Tax=Thermolongibacillus altinsuensis TaxID=575256 RepID=A0A4R1QQ56_9BACL|nr:DUF2777 family protein [Thermolongibacillus altinsuensis]TCL51065.1 uncharacterized protein DUF2777 [Thermolongibacillus altinsuensis]GMB08864.1 hypothetical protein B1no1_15740 [Thermolongibacillus altinsuensis]
MGMDRFVYIHNQKRAHIYGTVECMNDEWIFFDEESEEACLLEEKEQSSVELFRFGKWIKGTLLEQGVISFSKQLYKLKNGDQIRFLKPLPYAYEQWLKQLSDHAFFHFTRLMNELNFSLYDCLYCYNHSLFANQGVNFLIYDNTKEVSNVQHYYERGENHKDRFEITIHTGKKLMGAQIE